MLQEPADNGTDPNVLRLSGYAGTQTAKAANDQINGDPGGRGPAQRFDDVRIFQLIHLGHNAGGLAVAAVLLLTSDQVNDAVPHGGGRNQERGTIRPAAMSGQIVEEVHNVARQPRITGEKSEIRVQTGGFHVIVAGADVSIAADAPRLFANHQRRLRMGLQPAYAERDVRPHAFQLRGPVQIALFVETGLDLHHAGDLLAVFRRPDQRADKGCVISNPVSGHLDRDRLRIIGGFADEVLHGGVETLVRMVQQHVARLNGGEHRGRAILKPGNGQWRPGAVPQFGQRKSHEFKERRVVDLSRHVITVGLVEFEPFAQHLANGRIGARTELQTDRGFVAAQSHLLFHGFANFGARVAVQFHLRIAGQASQRAAGERHAAVQLVRVAGNHVIKRHKQHLAFGKVRVQGYPVSQARRYAHAGVHRLRAAGVGQVENQRHGEVGDERKGVGHIDHEWRQGRRKVGVEIVGGLRLLRRSELVPVPQLHAVRGEPGYHVPAEAYGLPFQCGRQFASQAIKQIAAFSAAAVTKHGHALHEELIQVGGENREEFGSFQKGRSRVRCFGENPLVKVQPTEVPVQPDSGEWGGKRGVQDAVVPDRSKCRCGCAHSLLG